MSEPFLEMKHITKTFPGGVVANGDVDFSVRAGEIHGLLGENGAGKTTLMNILFGLYSPDDGEIWLDGEQVEIQDPSDAIRNGIGMVHQEFKLIGKLSVFENITLSRHERKTTAGVISNGGRAIRNRLALHSQDVRDEIERLIQRYDFEIDPDRAVGDLDVGQQQRVEILKALYQDADLLILDEPTAALTPRDIEKLFDVLRQLSSEGVSIIFITHKLNELTTITERVTVLRDGRVVSTVPTDSTSHEELAKMMIGDTHVQTEIESRRDEGAVLLSAENVTVHDHRGIRVLDGIDLSIRENEIVGVAGVSGNGQQPLAKCLVGVQNVTEGSIQIDGVDVTNAAPRKYIDNGVAYIPADRRREGCAPEESVLHNLLLKHVDEFERNYLLSQDESEAYAEALVDEYNIQTPGVHTSAKHLSGGNLQKLILARELSSDPSIVIAHQPTRGLDVDAIEYVVKTLQRQKDRGTGILLISEELDEVLRLSDRILVLYEGKIVYEVEKDDFDRELIGEYMAKSSEA